MAQHLQPRALESCVLKQLFWALTAVCLSAGYRLPVAVCPQFVGTLFSLIFFTSSDIFYFYVSVLISKCIFSIVATLLMNGIAPIYILQPFFSFIIG